MKRIILVYDDADFQKLKSLKEKQEKTSEERIKWEDFVFNAVLKK